MDFKSESEKGKKKRMLAMQDERPMYRLLRLHKENHVY